MERNLVSIQVASSIDESPQDTDVRLILFDRLVSGEQSEEGPCGFDGLSALPAPATRSECTEDAIAKLTEAFSKAAL